MLDMCRVRGLTFFWLVAAVFCAAQRYPILPVPDSPHDITALFQDRESRLWVGTKNDVLCFDGQRFYSLRDHGFAGESVNSLAEDDQGGIWIGTEGSVLQGGAVHGGLYRFWDGNFEKVLSDDILSVAPVAPGVMVVSVGLRSALQFGGLYRIVRTASGWRPELLAEKSATYITVDHTGTIYYPCPGGACKLTREQIMNWPRGWSNVPFLELRGDSFPDRILHDRFGCLWIRAEISASVFCPDRPKRQIVVEELQGKPDSFRNIVEGP